MADSRGEVELCLIADPATRAYVHMQTVWPHNPLREGWCRLLVIAPEGSQGEHELHHSVYLDTDVVRFEEQDIEAALRLAQTFGNVRTPEEWARERDREKCP